MKALLLITLAALLNNSALVMIRFAGNGIHWAWPVFSISLGSLACIGGGFLAYGLTFFLVMYILGIHDFNLAVPLFLAMQFAFNLLAAHFIFHESMTWSHLGGILLILAGVLVVAGSKS